MNRFFIFLLLAIVSTISYCKSEPIVYDLTILQENLTQAASENKNLIVIFGASWCPDCLALDQILTEPKLDTLLQNKYSILKIDVGRFDKNLDINQKLGDPIDSGIPALVIIDPKKNLVIANTTGGEFSNASKMSADQVLDYLNQF